jgi:hypothetical protein
LIYYCRDIDLYNDSGGGRNATDRRMLFDLANEALQALVHGTKTGSSLGQWVVSVSVSRGRKLVDDVWQQVICSTLLACSLFLLLLFSIQVLFHVSGASFEETPDAGNRWHGCI